MCLIDSTNDGPRPDPDARLTTTVIQAHDRSRLRRVLGILGRNPSSIPYRRNGALGELLVQSLGRTHWDLVWCVRARVHVLTRSLISGPRIVDFDDLYDRLLLTQIRDRRRELGPIGTAPRNLFEWVDARRWSRLQKTVASEVDKVVICSTLDRDRLGASNAAVVPNGYPNPLHSHGEGAARAMTGESPRLSLLFVGPLTYEPNRLAIHWMVENVLPRLRERMPRVALTVVGDDRGVSVRSMDRGRGAVHGSCRRRGAVLRVRHGRGGAVALRRRYPAEGDRGSRSWGAIGVDVVRRRGSGRRARSRRPHRRRSGDVRELPASHSPLNQTCDSVSSRRGSHDTGGA